MTTLGKRLRWLRRDRDLTQEKAAALAGVQARSIRDWEADKHMPSLGALTRLATLYGVSVDSLVVLTVASAAIEVDDFSDSLALHDDPFGVLGSLAEMEDVEMQMRFSGSLQ